MLLFGPTFSQEFPQIHPTHYEFMKSSSGCPFLDHLMHLTSHRRPVSMGTLSHPHLTSPHGHAGIWDDRYSATTADFGGHCLLDADIEEFKRDPSVEVVSVALANDGALEGMTLESDANPDCQSISCLRPVTNFRHMLIPSFGEVCVEGIDRALFLEYQVR